VKTKRLDAETYALVFDTDDEAMEGLLAFAREHALSAARFTAIGAFSEAVVGYFDWEQKDYRRIPVNEQVEVLALTGDIARDENGDPAVHAHVVLGRVDGSVRGGHLISGRVRPTLEVMLVKSPAHLRKRKDPQSGLPLIALDDAEDV
jgi:predicted DNA-binding protein with PD1-like motif